MNEWMYTDILLSNRNQRSFYLCFCLKHENKLDVLRIFCQYCTNNKWPFLDLVMQEALGSCILTGGGLSGKNMFTLYHLYLSIILDLGWCLKGLLILQFRDEMYSVRF